MMITTKIDFDKLYSALDKLLATIRDDTISQGPFATTRISAKNKKTNRIVAHVPLTKVHDQIANLDTKKIWVVDQDIVECVLALHFGKDVIFRNDCKTLSRIATVFSNKPDYKANLTIQPTNVKIQGVEDMLEIGNPDFAITEQIVEQIINDGAEALYVTQSQMWTAPAGYQGNTKRAAHRKKIQSRGDLYVKHNPHNFFEGEGEAKVLTSTFHSKVNDGSNITVETYYPEGAPANYTAQPGDALPGDGAAYDLVKNYFDTMKCDRKLVQTLSQDHNYVNSSPQKYLKRIDASGNPVYDTVNKRSDLTDLDKVCVAHNPHAKDRSETLTGLLLGSVNYIPKGTDVISNQNKIISIIGEYVPHHLTPAKTVEQMFTPDRARSVASALKTIYNQIVYAGFNFKGQGIYSSAVTNYCGIPDGTTVWTDESFAEHYKIPQALTDLCNKIACK
jgi:hypothetical protein